MILDLVLTKPWEVGALISIFQIRKLKFRKMQRFAPRSKGNLELRSYWQAWECQKMTSLWVAAGIQAGQLLGELSGVWVQKLKIPVEYSLGTVMGL